MNIKKIYIKNFRHFKEFELSLLDEKFNLIVWENWIWKTTIFDCLRILFDSNIFLGKFFNEKDFNGNWNLIIEALIEFQKDDSHIYLFKDCINKINDDTIEVLLWFYQENSDSEWIYFWKKSFINEVNFDQIRDYKINPYEIRKFIQVIYIDWTRAEQNFYAKDSFYNKVWKYLYEINKDKQKLVDLNKDELKNNNIMKKVIDFSEPENLFKYLNDVRLTQDWDKHITLDPDDNLPQSTFLNLLKLNIDEKHLDKNSTGWQYIIFTIFAIFYIKELEKLIKKEDEIEKYHLILMEEPEAHLHPQMQRNLLNFIKSKFWVINNSSLLVSTHSPNIIRAIKDIEKTIFINKDSQTSLPIKLEKDILEFKNKLNIFVDVNKAEMLFSRWIIFVEWIAEEILMPKFFQNYTNKTLDNYWISVINVNSTDFYCYALYAERLKIPWVIVTDWDITKDEEYQWITRKDNHLDIFSHENYFIWFDTFEIDIIFEWNKDKILESFLKIDTQTRKDNFSSKIDELLIFDYLKKDKEIYKSNYEAIRNSILDNYISKSNLAYSLFENIDSAFIIPYYIKQSFDSITKKLETKGIEEIHEIETTKIERKSYISDDEISIEEIPF